MIDIDNELKKIAEAETTDSSYYMIKSNSDTLIVSFATLNPNASNVPKTPTPRFA